jgi:four helix bundle protein
MSQMRRAAVSVASNIAEGHGRRTLPAYLNHLSMALGSQAELETQVDLSHRLNYLDDSEANEVLDLTGRGGRRLHALMRSLEEKNGTVGSFSRTQRLVSGSQSPEQSKGHFAPSTQHLIPNTHKEVEA